MWRGAGQWGPGDDLDVPHAQLLVADSHDGERTAANLDALRELVDFDIVVPEIDGMSAAWVKLAPADSTAAGNPPADQVSIRCVATGNESAYAMGGHVDLVTATVLQIGAREPLTDQGFTRTVASATVATISREHGVLARWYNEICRTTFTLGGPREIMTTPRVGVVVRWVDDWCRRHWD